MRRVALVLAIALLAGCAGAPATDAPTTTPSPIATPSATPSPTDPPVSTPFLYANAPLAALSLRSLNASPTVVDIGLPVTLAATVRNFGYHPGSAEVRFELADGASTDRTANAHRGETVVVRATLIPALLGNGTATARLGNETAIANFTVVGPRIAELDFRATPTAPCGPVAVRSSFWNLGTGRARDVHADLRIMDAAGLLLADFTTSIGDVAAGQLAESEGVVEEVKAVCSGDPQVYRFWLVVRAEGVTETSMTGSFVA